MKAKQVLHHLQITRPTLTSYVKNGKLRVEKLHNGRYEYNNEDVFSLKTNNKLRHNVIYARVSTSNQKKDLENQINTISEFMLKNGIIQTQVFSDVASGMNLDRKQFLTLFDQIIINKIDKVFITYKDRLTRLHFEFIEKLFNTFGTSIVALNEIDSNKSTEQEFFEDLTSMIHSFSMKMYSKRRKQKLELIAKDLKLESKIEADLC